MKRDRQTDKPTPGHRNSMKESAKGRFFENSRLFWNILKKPQAIIYYHVKIIFKEKKVMNFWEISNIWWCSFLHFQGLNREEGIYVREKVLKDVLIFVFFFSILILFVCGTSRQLIMFVIKGGWAKITKQTAKNGVYGKMWLVYCKIYSIHLITRPGLAGAVL